MLNMDFRQSVVIDTERQDWIASPKAGVWRKPLAREEAEQGHATSVVKYEPGASFPPHNHPKGEEILVLEGTFSDETGDFKAGTYFRNPAGYRHAPFSTEGCLLFVKLHQFHPDDDHRISLDTHYKTLSHKTENKNQVTHLPLHEFGTENVALLSCPKGSQVGPPNSDAGSTHNLGRELFVLTGTITDGESHYLQGTWIRLATDDDRELTSSKDSVIWFKQGHF